MGHATEALQESGEATFRARVDPLVPELRAYCYRMLGSARELEDAMQEVLLRAWRGLPHFEGRSELRSWLYRIATNVCLTAVRRRTDSDWVEPYPDELLGLEDGRAAPHARYEQRESVELAFIAALQHLSPRQRAALILREVLGFSAAEVAGTLGTSVAAVNSALQHARRRMGDHMPDHSQQVTLRALGDQQLHDVVNRYAEALACGDVDGMVAMLTEDATWSMPPTSRAYRGRAAIVDFLVAEPFTIDWRYLRARANGQPALGWYRWYDEPRRYVAEVLEVLTLRGRQVRSVTAFIDRDLFARFGLPDELPDEGLRS